jgi:hypothetical protein
VITRVSLEMSLSRADFLRLLPSALDVPSVEETDGVFRGADGPRVWTIRLIPLVDRHLGSVTLPCHRIEISLEGHSKTAAAAFLARFHRGFLRGGG